jgi:aspartyl-tRNA(Asn)/glutamyl-tRNA(Gln) amidotransferase subunit A
VGLKPTYGLVPLDGIFPLSPSCDHAGTLTATAAGGAALLAVIAGLPPPPAQPRPAAAGVSIGVLAGQLADPSVTSEVRGALDEALATLAAAGFRVTEIRPQWLEELPRFEHALGVIVGYEAFRIHEHRETSKYADGTRALLEFGRWVTAAQYADALAVRAELAAAIDVSLDGVDVLAGPTVGYCAPEEDPPFGVGDDNAEGRFTGPYNLSGHPAVSLPVPVPGLPVGLQLAGQRGSDLDLLAIASAAEGALAVAV